MPDAPRKLRLSFQTKVQLVVLAFLVLVPAVMVWMVDRHIRQQVHADAQQTLSTAETVFLKSLQIRSRDLLSRYRNFVNEPRFKAAALLPDATTLNNFLHALLEELGDENEAFLFVTDKGELRAGVRRDTSQPLDSYEQAAAPYTARALSGDAAVGSISLGDRVFTVVSVPVTVGARGSSAGALTICLRNGNTMAQDFKALTRTEVLFVAEGRFAASTLARPELYQELRQQIPSLQSAEDADVPRAVLPVVVNDERFLALISAHDWQRPSRGFRYLLLSSYEERLRALAETRRTLVELSLVGILLSAGVVSYFVRKVTRPLRALRDTAEAVGRGDFSRRIERFSNDECGDVAEAFNRMTTNLQGSRAELEKTVETLKTTQEQLVQSEKLSAVGQFVAGVAHELNNPLTAVIGFSDLLRHTSADSALKPQLEIIAKSAQRCHKIVHSLLSFARQHPPERKLVKINGVIDEVLEIMAYDFRTSNIAVVREYASDLPMIMADAHQLQQVFVNILSNARQAIQSFRRDGRIVVRTVVDGRNLRIEFSDNGPGISAENITRIFDPFFTTKAVGKGTGLGLSLSYGIVSEHHGKIVAQSEPGKGATFVIELPVAVEATAVASAPQVVSVSRSPWPSGPSGRSVLVIDDEDWILSLAERLLKKDGHVVETALSGDEAIEALRRKRFDVIVSDWKMPGLSGIQLYEQIVAVDGTAGDRVLFMTGDVISDTFQDFLRRHEKTCLAKPFSIEDFRSAVRKIGGLR